MEEIYEIEYDKCVRDIDIPSLGVVERDLVRTAIESKLRVKPMCFGKPLHRPLSGYWTLRVADYRIIYKLSYRTILVICIIHRSFGYGQKLQKVVKRRCLS